MLNQTVLVTGGTGFVAGHCIVQLLGAGYRVRTTVRSLDREGAVRATVKSAGIDPADRLGFVVASLDHDKGWAEAVGGCQFILHVASPFPQSVPKSEDELIVPAREGTLRVLRAARDAAVQRAVITSSFAAIGYGHAATAVPFDESSWTKLGSPDVQPYIKSKTLAERAAWDFIAREGGALELSVINPVGIFGPVLDPHLSSSVAIIKLMLDGAMPACPRLDFCVVDVRDVADLHIRAMISPAAKGERFLAAAGESMSMLDVAQVLRRRVGQAAWRVPKRQLPNWLVRLVALGNADLRQAVPQLGKVREVTSDKAKRLLSWAPRSNEEAIIATAESLIHQGLLSKRAA